MIEYFFFATVAKDFLVIPAFKVAIEKLFNRDQDVLELGRQAINGETIHILILSRDMYKLN